MKKSHLAFIGALVSVVLTVLLFILDYLYDTGEKDDSIALILLTGAIYWIFIFACLYVLHFLFSLFSKFLKNKG
jgi:hypothetical protein